MFSYILFEIIKGANSFWPWKIQYDSPCMDDRIWRVHNLHQNLFVTIYFSMALCVQAQDILSGHDSTCVGWGLIPPSPPHPKMSRLQCPRCSSGDPGDPCAEDSSDENTEQRFMASAIDNSLIADLVDVRVLPPWDEHSPGVRTRSTERSREENWVINDQASRRNGGGS